MTSTMVQRILSRRAGADGGFAMLTVILLIMVCAAVSILMLGVVIAQVKPTVFEGKNTRTISAAEAGVDATTSQFRTATVKDAITSVVSGDPRLLPCTVKGTVGASGSTLRYDVSIRYYAANPESRDAAWRQNFIVCSPTAGLIKPPAYAIITSVGSDAAVAGYGASVGNRTLETIYAFQSTNSAANGGVIYSFGDAYCLQADTPAVAGAKIHYVAAVDCRVDATSRLWSYDNDYGIHLSVTDLVGGNPLCITGSGGVDVTLQKCVKGQTNQMFSWEGGAHWRGQNASNTGYSSECLGVGDSSAVVLTGKTLNISSLCANVLPWGSFDPDPRVGAGAAGYTTHQVVSFLEFGRCFDVTHENVLEASMIIYPCKQDPTGTGTNLLWNHKWYYTEPSIPVGSSVPVGSLSGQQIKVINGGSFGTSNAAYCLKTPANGLTPAYPTLAICSTSSPDQQWTRTAQADTYANSWTFTDEWGRCIGLGGQYDPVSDPWTQMVVAPCDFGPDQKWNAPTAVQPASLGDYKELN